MTTPLRVEQADIKTLSVEIRVVKIDKRQMTLSVFKQLPMKHILNEDLDLRGEPWGVVNYFWDGCGVYGRHLHILWVGEGRLWRCCCKRLSLSPYLDAYRKVYDLAGDPDGLRFCGFNANIAGSSVGVKSDEIAVVRHKVWQWNEAVDQFATLDQLFIAV